MIRSKFYVSSKLSTEILVGSRNKGYLCSMHFRDILLLLLWLAMFSQLSMIIYFAEVRDGRV